MRRKMTRYRRQEAEELAWSRQSNALILTGSANVRGRCAGIYQPYPY